MQTRLATPPKMELNSLEKQSLHRGLKLNELINPNAVLLAVTRKGVSLHLKPAQRSTLVKCPPMLPIIVRFLRLVLIIFIIAQIVLAAILFSEHLIGRHIEIPWVLRAKIAGAIGVLFSLPFLAREERNFRRSRRQRGV